MEPEIFDHFVTFGVQYGRRPDDDVHPLGMFADGYAVIEAPDLVTAHRIAGAIFGQQWAFIYPSWDFEMKYHPEGELMRISWTWRALS